MKTDNLYTNTEARDKLISGIRKTAEAVGATMGTGGSNAVIEAIEYPGHMVTNDGATIANAIRFADPLEEMGRKILLEAINRANKQSGDGSSTTTVLCAAILEEGIKHLDKVSSMEIKRSLEDCIKLIEESIDAQKRLIEVHEVGQVASISAEDEKIGALIQEIYEQIGPKGIIHWDISKTIDDSYTIGTGITIDGAGYVSPYMCDMDAATGQVQTVARMKNVSVLLIKDKITTAGVFENIFSQLSAKGTNEVIVFCDDFEATVIPQLVQTRVVRGFKAVMVKMPTFWKDQWYEDLAKASGAMVIDSNSGVTLQSMALEHLGRFGNVTVEREATYIDGMKDISEHIKDLEDQKTDDSLLRASRLNTATARLFIGAHSDSALSYKRLKVEDAIAAAYQAINGGIVAGGGVALLNVALSFDPLETTGKSILRNALQRPYRQILENSSVSKEILRVAFSSEGVDSRTGEIVDMFEAGIVDPAIIVLNAVKQAISVSAAILTTKSIVTLPKAEGGMRMMPDGNIVST